MKIPMTDNYEIKNNIKIGQHIFESVPENIKPTWGKLILSRFDKHIEDIPDTIKELYDIIEDEKRWGEAHSQFTRIRAFALDNPSFKPDHYLSLAEKIAKTTYNISTKSALFDSDSGFYIPGLALKAAGYYNDYLEDEVKSAILIFSNNKKFIDDIKSAKEFLSYKAIGDILWHEWDPIGVNDFAPADEYQGYAPEIFRLKTSGADRIKIAEKLFEFETINMGMIGNLEHCFIVADKILKV